MKMALRHSGFAFASAAFAALTVFLFILLAAAALHASFTDRSDIVAPVGLLWLSCGVLYVATSFLSRCPACHRNIFTQWYPSDRLHPQRSRFGKLVDGWQAIVADILLHRRFNCMKCGVLAELNMKGSLSP